MITSPGQSGIEYPADAVAAVVHTNPYLYYARLVAEKPFGYCESVSMRVAASAEAVSAVLASELCHVRPVADPVPAALVGTDAGEIFRRLIRTNDRDERCAVKRSVSTALDGVDDAHLARVIDFWARTLLPADAVLSDIGRHISDIAFRVPASVVASLLGFRTEHTCEICLEVDSFVRSLAPSCTPDQSDAGKIAATRLSERCNALLNDAESRAGVLAQVARELKTLDCGDRLVVVANGIGLLVQTYEATAGLIGITLVAMSKEAALREAVKVDPAIATQVVREVLRLDSPVQNTRRYVVSTGNILGVPVREGESVLVVLAAANRDPKANAHPDRFDIHRSNPRAFTFGCGPHACPGEVLAVTIAAKAVQRILDIGVDLDRLCDGITYRPSANVRIPVFAHEASTR